MFKTNEIKYSGLFLETVKSKQHVIQTSENQRFRKTLIAWNATAESRDLPWKKEADPYKIWLSEIILQQTRVEQGRSYYNNFLEKYPSICDLARAKDDDVFSLWSGLGYYNRCRNLLSSARFICNELNGVFPKTYESILSLKGVGPYSAAAISSFAYNLPQAVVDGNVVRVLSRFFGLNFLPNNVANKKMYQNIADKLLDKKQPGEFNQAIMDFGATMCKPKNPCCINCPMSKKCVAFKNEQVHAFPPKKQKIRLKERKFHYLLPKTGDSLFLRKRNKKDIWQNLYEPVNIEGPLPKSLSSQEPYDQFSQKLSHQHIHAGFYKVSSKEMALLCEDFEDYERISISKISSLPFPIGIKKVLEKDFE